MYKRLCGLIRPDVCFGSSIVTSVGQYPPDFEEKDRNAREGCQMMLKRSPKNGLLKTPGAPALRASSSA